MTTEVAREKQATADTEGQIASRLVARILNGETPAETEMVERYQRGLYVMLFNRSKDKALAEDVAQQTWLLVLNKIRNNELRDHSKLAAFIIQIGKNQLLMHYRSERKVDLASEEETYTLAAEGLSPEQAAINSQLGEQMQTVFNELSQPRDRKLIQQYYLTARSKADLCEEYRLTPAHFDRVLHRARERFKRLWESRSHEQY